MNLVTLSAIAAILSAMSPAVIAGVIAARHSDSTANSDKLLNCVENALLGDLIDYRIVTPEEKEYTTVSTGVILSTQFPALVVYATQIEEVVNLVQCAVLNGYNVTPRSGSHHFENWSALNGTLVVDISHLNYVKPSKDLQTAVVGAGARLGTIYSILGQYDRTWIAGICPSVGLGGYLSVGGYNMQMRQHGLAVDWLESAKVVLANGTLVTASATENSDLWWAMRGGGTYGLTVEATLKLITLPRSAMLSMLFPKESRLESLQKFLDWAPKQDPRFNSQLNLHGDYVNILGWYLGGTVDELTAIVQASGLQDVPGAQFNISGNCNTENSRNFWLYTQTTCTDDETAHELQNTWFNVIPDDLVPLSNITYGFDNVPALPNEIQAQLWPHLDIIDKTFIQREQSSLTAADLLWIVENTGELPAELAVWGEITTFNLTSAPASTGAFPWFNDAEIMFRFEVNRVANESVLQQGETFINDLDDLLLSKLGSASYAGYIDSDIKADPHYAYWGENVDRLAQVKAAYDPSDRFSNPFSIRPKV